MVGTVSQFNFVFDSSENLFSFLFCLFFLLGIKLFREREMNGFLCLKGVNWQDPILLGKVGLEGLGGMFTLQLNPTPLNLQTVRLLLARISLSYTHAITCIYTLLHTH